MARWEGYDGVYGEYQTQGPGETSLLLNEGEEMQEESANWRCLALYDIVVRRRRSGSESDH